MNKLILKVMMLLSLFRSPTSTSVQVLEDIPFLHKSSDPEFLANFKNVMGPRIAKIKEIFGSHGSKVFDTLIVKTSTQHLNLDRLTVRPDYPLVDYKHFQKIKILRPLWGFGSAIFSYFKILPKLHLETQLQQYSAGNITLNVSIESDLNQVTRVLVHELAHAVQFYQLSRNPMWQPFKKFEKECQFPGINGIIPDYAEYFAVMVDTFICLQLKAWCATPDNSLMPIHELEKFFKKHVNSELHALQFKVKKVFNQEALDREMKKPSEQWKWPIAIFCTGYYEILQLKTNPSTKRGEL